LKEAALKIKKKLLGVTKNKIVQNVSNSNFLVCKKDYKPFFSGNIRIESFIVINFYIRPLLKFSQFSHATLFTKINANRLWKDTLTKKIYN
jgi:hypothetical protein